MTARARLQNANDSKSLWNYTLSPGWSPFDAHILRLAIMHHGCGSWRSIGRYFPLKNCNQLNLQTQRLFGQQALAEFQKVHIDPHRIRQINDKIEGFRKNNCLINTGNNMTLQEREKRRNAHIAKHGIPKELYERLTIPVVLDPPKPCTTLVDKIEKLREMYRCVYDIQLRLKQLQENNGENAANIRLKARKKAQEEQTSDAKAEPKAVAKKDEEKDVAMVMDESNKNQKVKPAVNNPAPIDDDMAIAIALSASMEAANIDTPAVEKKSKKRKQSTKKKKKPTKRGSRKRKKMDELDEEYCPQPSKKRVKRK